MVSPIGMADELGFQAVGSDSDLNFGTTNRRAEKLLRVYFRTACLSDLPYHDVDAGAGGDRSTGRVDHKLVEVHHSSGILALALAKCIERGRLRT